MGTHPIFESDFDCLTEKMENIVVEQRKLYEITETDRFDKTPVREYTMDNVRESFVESAAAFRLANPESVAENESDDFYLPLHLTDNDIASVQKAVDKCRGDEAEMGASIDELVGECNNKDPANYEKIVQFCRQDLKRLSEQFRESVDRCNVSKRELDDVRAQFRGNFQDENPAAVIEAQKARQIEIRKTIAAKEKEVAKLQQKTRILAEKGKKSDAKFKPETEKMAALLRQLK